MKEPCPQCKRKIEGVLDEDMTESMGTRILRINCLHCHWQYVFYDTTDPRRMSIGLAFMPWPEQEAP